MKISADAEEALKEVERDANKLQSRELRQLIQERIQEQREAIKELRRFYNSGGLSWRPPQYEAELATSPIGPHSGSFAMTAILQPFRSQTDMSAGCAFPRISLTCGR